MLYKGWRMSYASSPFPVLGSFRGLFPFDTCIISGNYELFMSFL